MCGGCGVDLVFAPSDGDLYPREQLTFVESTLLSAGLCGAHRPGHFRGVATELLRKAGAEMLEEKHPKPFQHGASIHYVGTARMGNDPKTSVVNPWNRCHDVPNLWINDAAAFVTAGNQNPTLTILALAMRSSERMVEQLREGLR